MNFLYLILQELGTVYQLISTIFVIILPYLAPYLILYIRVIEFMFQVKFLLTWYPNLNPYIQPFYGINFFCESFSGWLKDYIPVIFGIDLAPMIFYTMIDETAKYLEKLIQIQKPESF